MESAAVVSASSQFLTIPALCIALREQHGVTITYSRLWRRALSGIIPCHTFGGKMLVDPADLPQIAAILRETEAPKPAPASSSAA
jgi:hypothetical protein